MTSHEGTIFIYFSIKRRFAIACSEEFLAIAIVGCAARWERCDLDKSNIETVCPISQSIN
ncbi:hypothetical protein H1P_1830014 [Hyella patelloides LEGE 07179]|uniref:Uncharacterized protein n=1 Tax=Hyella patelloides LEGE 07179 TaxID=945734 RepID=A0A563VNU1_9CYAN|nr:hypothetical protein H1P_1830014 [Hyella patelloides LEGE 07179]